MLVKGTDIDPIALLPHGIDDHMKALDHFARAILEHPPAVDRAVEVLRQIEHRLFGAVTFHRYATAATKTEETTGEAGQPQGFHHDDLQNFAPAPGERGGNGLEEQRQQAIDGGTDRPSLRKSPGR